MTGWRNLAIGLALMAASLPITSVAAQDNTTFELDCERIAAFLESAVADGRIVGGSSFVWQDGAEQCFADSGKASREDGTSFARDTLVQIFSMTKPVTGTALMQLWQQGRFGLDDPLYWYLPEFATVSVFDGYDNSGEPILRAPVRPITIRDTLRHTAGFAYGSSDDFVGQRWDALDPLSPDSTLAEFTLALGQAPLVADPGTQWHYSAGVDVQARLVEILSGQKFSDYVREHILAPLAMDDSGWARDPADLARLARIYIADDDGVLQPMDRGDWLRPNFAGKPMTMGGSGLVSTVDDYMRFARMLLNDGELDGARILEPATVALMTTDQLDPRIAPEDRSFLTGKGNGGFGIDLFVRTGPPLTREENRGTVGEFYWDGWPSMLFWVDPRQDMAVILAVQKVPFDNDLHRDFRSAVYGADYTGPAQ